MTRKSLHTAHAAPLIALGLLIATASRASAGAPVGVGDESVYSIPIRCWSIRWLGRLNRPDAPMPSSTRRSTTR